MATSDISRKHTPGPWHFQVSPSGNSGNIFHTAVTTAYHVGTFTSGSRREIGTFLDNARLIAAAPELLDALETLMNEAIPKGNRFLLDMLPPEKRAIYDDCLAAIAKARRAA